ncbi:hypothetical protein GGI04_002570 [Coemansia thaxteri]|nr:hypothetical protein GGI04_002570 [Coemansia thaxteri]KAJ2471267.1 hypothetical protein GGI02_002384 [Coemansia sp. RSA 2322]
MPNADELHKRVDTLQKQLRKAGDHLKQLAAENGALSEQVEKLSEREAQFHTQMQENADAAIRYQQEISQFKAENKQLAEARERQSVDAGESQDLQPKVQQLEQRIAELVSRSETAASQTTACLDEWETAAKAWKANLGVPADSDATAVIQAVTLRLVDVPLSSSSDLTQEVEQLRAELDAEKKSTHALKQSKSELELQLHEYASGMTAVSEFLSNGINSASSIPDAVPEALRPGLRLAVQQLGQTSAADEDGRSTREARVAELEQQLEETRTKLRNVTEAREELAQDYDHLLERIGTMKDALTAKMSAESEQVKRLRKEAGSAKSAATLAERKAAQSEKAAQTLEQSLQALRNEFDETKRALWESQEAANRLQGEYADLSDDTQRQVASLQAKFMAAEAQLEADSAQRDQLEDRVEQLQSDLNQALNSESQWVDEREVHLVTIQNLQSALEHLQESKDAEVDMAVEKLREELRGVTKEHRAAISRAERAEGQLRKTELSNAAAEQSQQRAAEQVGEIERLRHDVAVLKDHLNESMRRLREESNEFNLDKRVITNLIVGFLAMPYGDSKRFEILQLMSSILQFSEEQQEKAGLIRKAGRRAPLQSMPSTPTSEAADIQLEVKDSFSDQWISFLLRESSSTRNRQS